MASYVLTPLLLGVEREATASGYFAMTTLAHPGDNHAERLVRQLAERRVEGIVGAALAHQGDLAYADALRSIATAVTVFAVAGGGIPNVTIDEHHTGLIATRHLLRLGHRTVAQIVGEPHTSPQGGRYSGYLAALAEAGIDVDSALTDYGLWTAEGGYRAAGRLLDRFPGLTAIFAHNDYMAIGAIRAVHDRGLRVPDDVSVIGCDDIDLAGFVSPALTTVQIPFDDLGAAAVRVLLDRVEHRRQNDEDLPQAPVDILRGELIVRRTTGPAG
jgi:LacI family transcriptional regulator